MKKIRIILMSICLIISMLFQAKSISLLANDSEITLQEANESTNQNLALVGNISGNLRDAFDNGMKYENGVYTMKYTGSWLRSITLVNNEISNCEKIYLNDNLINTNTLNLYYSATINYTLADIYRTAGIVIGKTKLENTLEEVYVSVNVSPNNKSLVMYFYKQVNGIEDVSYEIPISLSFVPNTDYKLEILKTNKNYKIYINGQQVSEISNYSVATSSSLYKIDLMSLTPVVGVNFMDIDATLSNLTFKYLNEGIYTSYNGEMTALKEGRDSSNENIFTLDSVKLSTNKRDPEDNGVTFLNNISNCEHTGSYLRATHLFTNKYLDCEELTINDSIVSTKDVNVYYKTTFNISNKPSDRILGIVIGKTKVLNQTVFVSS